MLESYVSSSSPIQSSKPTQYADKLFFLEDLSGRKIEDMAYLVITTSRKMMFN
jgi:hypothetical protein